MKNNDILNTVHSYFEEKSKNEKEREAGFYITEVSYPASVAWKRYLNFKDLIKARDAIFAAMAEIKALYFDEVHSELTGKVDPNTGEEIRKVKDEFAEEFTQRITDILEQDTEIPVRKVKISELEDVSLTEADIQTLAFMIEEE